MGMDMAIAFFCPNKPNPARQKCLVRRVKKIERFQIQSLSTLWSYGYDTKGVTGFVPGN
jgi:hypothetical protein